MVTAEMAVGLPAVVAILLMAISVVSAVSSELTCTSTAAGIARMASRGDSAAAIDSYVAEQEPFATWQVANVDGLVTVHVDSQLRFPVVGGVVPVTLKAQAVLPDEPGVGGQPIESSR